MMKLAMFERSCPNFPSCHHVLLSICCYVASTCRLEARGILSDKMSNMTQLLPRTAIHGFLLSGLTTSQQNATQMKYAIVDVDIQNNIPTKQGSPKKNPWNLELYFGSLTYICYWSVRTSTCEGHLSIASYPGDLWEDSGHRALETPKWNFLKPEINEPCCKLRCIVSWFEVTFKQGFEGFSWETIGDAL